MALVDGDGWNFNVSEWWDALGEHHDGPPRTIEDLLGAREMTGHLEYYDENGQYKGEAYYDLASDDGWLYDELAAEATDAANHYEEAA